MKFLGTLQNISGANVDVDGHTHPKSEISDMPTKLSQFSNDLGLGQTLVAQLTTPATPTKGLVWIQV